MTSAAPVGRTPCSRRPVKSLGPEYISGVEPELNGLISEKFTLSGVLDDHRLDAVAPAELRRPASNRRR